MTLERIADILETERRENAAFRVEITDQLGAIRGDLKALEAKHDSHKTVVKVLAWCAVFGVSIIAIAATVSCQ